MRILTAITATTLMGLICASSAYADNRAGALTLGLGGGYVRFDAKRHIDNTGVKFGELGYDFNEKWGLEGLLGFFSTTSHQEQDYNRSVNGTLFAVDAVYRFMNYKQIEPFVLLGPGISSMNPNGNDANTQGNVNAGVGAQYFFHPDMALRLEARDFYTFVGGKNDLFFAGALNILWG